MDARSPTDDKYISESEGVELANKIKANGFIECSAVERINIEEVFVTAVRAATNTEEETKTLKKCCVIS